MEPGSPPGVAQTDQETGPWGVPACLRTGRAGLICSDSAYGMSRDDDYRKQAADAQRMADNTANQIDKESWLRIAQGWLSLIRKPKRTATDRFDDALHRRGTRQKDSNESH